MVTPSGFVLSRIVAHLCAVAMVTYLFGCGGQHMHGIAVRSSEIEGTWGVAAESRHMLDTWGKTGTVPQITFATNAHFFSREFPFLNARDGVVDWLTVDGSWSLRKRFDGSWSIHLAYLDGERQRCDSGLTCIRVDGNLMLVTSPDPRLSIEASTVLLQRQ